MLPFFSILSANFFSTVLQFETNFENVKNVQYPSCIFILVLSAKFHGWGTSQCTLFFLGGLASI